MSYFPNAAQLLSGRFWFHLLFFLTLARKKIPGKNIIHCAQEKKKGGRQLYLW